MIDEATKRFIVWANNQYTPVALELEDAKVFVANLPMDGSAKTLARDIQLTGNPQYQFNQIAKHLTTRLSQVLKLRRRIFDYQKRVSIEEQPFKRVLDLIENARRRQGIEADVNEDDSMLQTRACLLATTLLIRCDLLLLYDVMKLRQAQIYSDAVPKPVCLKQNRKACEDLLLHSTKSQNILQQVESHLFFVQYAIFECQATGTGEHLKCWKRFKPTFLRPKHLLLRIRIKQGLLFQSWKQ